MNTLPAPQLPALSAASHLFDQFFNFGPFPRPETGRVSINNHDKRDDGDNIGEEQMARVSPEVERRDEQQQGPSQRAGQQGGKRPRLQLKNAKARGRLERVFEDATSEEVREMMKG